MNSYWMVVGLALLPVAGNFAGGMFAEFFETSKSRLNKALHAAAGIVIVIVSVELMPEALEKISSQAIATVFGLGGVTYVLINQVVSKLQGASDEKGACSTQGMWMVYIAVSVDLACDGLMIGTGSAVSIKDKGVPRSRRILLAASFAIPVVAAASTAYFVLRNQSEVWQVGALAFTAGLLTLAAIEDMVSEAHESVEDTSWSLLPFTGGFVLFVLVSARLEG